MRAVRGVHDAFTWLTVAPLPQPHGEFDRRRGGRAIAAVPLVGVVLGLVCAVIASGLARTGLPTSLDGVVLVAVLALATRGMHVDGLADTADGLGSYGGPERVRTVMRSGDVGPFGAATLLLVLFGQAVAFGAFVDDRRWWAVATVVFVSRASVPVVCRRGLSAANTDGFGALVAGTQRWSVAVWSVLAVGAAVAVGLLDSASGAARGAATVVVVLAFAWAFSRHVARRAGGLTGDVIGATIELTAVLTAVGLLL